MAESPLYVQYPAEAPIAAKPHHEAFHIPFLPRSAHLRHLIGLGVAGTASLALLGTVLYPLLGRNIVMPAVFAHPAQIAARTPAMEKSNRIEAHRKFDGNRFAEVAEKLSSGETRIFAYHRLTLVFKGDGDRPEPTVASSFGDDDRGENSQPTATFADFRGSIEPQTADFTSTRRARFPVRGVPLNVSVSRAGAAQVKEYKRLVSMPKSRQDLTDILETAGVSEENRDQLVDALASDTVVPGNSLELLLEKDPDGAQPKLIMAKLNGDRGRSRVAARDDSDEFVPVADDRLFSTLYSEGQPDAPSSTEIAAVDLRGVDDNGSETLKHKLERAGLTTGATTDLLRLADANGIPLDDSDDAPDSVDLLFRKSDDGKTELMFIEFHAGDEAHRFYLHRNSPEGLADFYDEKGRSVAKVLAHRPVPGGKLGDGFAWRIHPILGVKKFHNGVDFRAPMGSPILAAGDGTVELISSETGYGKYVRIRHDGGYETTYAHIASAASDLKVGDRVTQGQVIAYVGSTGYSTGPHLYYELRVNGRYEDPLTASLPAGTNLTGKSLDNLRSQVNHVDNIMSYLDVPPGPTGKQPFQGFNGAGPGFNGGGPSRRE